MKLTCSCLNMKIHVQGSSLSALDVGSLNLTHEQSSDQFFTGQIAAAVPDLGGITQELQCLTRSRSVGDWVVFSCINCSIDTHAVHSTQGLNNVLVSLNLQSDPAYSAELVKSDGYSPAFRVVLKRWTEDAVNKHGVSPGTERLESVRSILRQQLIRYLHKEEQSSEDRIRQFTIEQKLMLETLQERENRNQEILLRLVSETEQMEAEKSPSSDMVLDTNLTPPMTPLATDGQTSETAHSVPDEELEDRIQDIPQPMAYHRQHLQRPIRLPQGGRLNGRRKFGGLNIKRMTHSLDSDGIFELDGIEPGTPALGNSEEDEEDEILMNDTIPSDLPTCMEVPESPGELPVTTSNGLYATSLPVSVPNWGRRGSLGNNTPREHNLDSDDDLLAGGEDQEHIAASINALARSVYNRDGTEIFGDLPRPRLNTMH